MLNFKKRYQKQLQGFTLIEVLIAILIATIFVTVAMQIMTLAAIFKARAQENAEATTWIQEDLEDVRFKADSMPFDYRTTLSANATAGTNSISVASATNLAVNDTLKIGLASEHYQITAISGTTLTIAPALSTNQVANAAILETTRCSAGQTDALADALRDLVIGASNQVFNSASSTKVFRTGQTFSMRRTATISANAPYNILQLKYEVSPGSTFDSTKAIAVFDTEVIPNVAFQCP
jgi:prepilin-type N-terminal cleavage/methylation domain-containing protein